MKKRLLEIRRGIQEIQKPFPKNNLITCYRDFLRVRDFLLYYRYNQKVFISLVELTFSIWESEKRINRISLLESITRYGNKKKKGKTDCTVEVNAKIFWLFKKCILNQSALTRKQRKEAKIICNGIVRNVILEEEDIKWLCDNVEKSELILNRVLRYPAKSGIISNWAKENFLNNNFRNRRAEIVGWILDENPDFEFDRQVLIDDFEYLNLKDINAIEEYEREYKSTKILSQQLEDVLPLRQLPPLNPDENYVEPPYVNISFPELKLTKRFYPVAAKHGEYPDYDRLRDKFYSRVDATHKITMLWAIAYSRLDKSIKSELMKKYYCNETYRSFLKICRKNKLLDLLKWLEKIEQ